MIEQIRIEPIASEDGFLNCGEFLEEDGKILVFASSTQGLAAYKVNQHGKILDYSEPK